MSRHVLFLADAFSSNYLSKDKTPFLYDCIGKGVYTEKIIPGVGFCERSEIFTGSSSTKSGYLTAIGFSPKKSPYRNMGMMLKVISFVDTIFSFLPIVRKVMRRILSYYIYRTEHPLNPYQIPFKLLKYFSLTEDYEDITKFNALGANSVFDEAVRNSKRIYHDSFTGLNKKNNGSDEDRLQMVLDESSGEYSLYLIYISTMDAIGHIYGPDSLETDEALAALDNTLMNFVDRFEKIHPDSTYIFLGDHGMVKVDNHIDINAIIKKMEYDLQLKLGLDYIYFLDSTMFRLWFFNDNVKVKIKSYLSDISELAEKGIFHNNELEFNLNKDTGDTIWYANSGVLINPDFFHLPNHVSLGMHGYLDCDKSGSYGMYIKFGNTVTLGTHKERHLHDIYHDILDAVS